MNDEELKEAQIELAKQIEAIKAEGGNCTKEAWDLAFMFSKLCRGLASGYKMGAAFSADDLCHEGMLHLSKSYQEKPIRECEKIKHYSTTLIVNRFKDMYRRANTLKKRPAHGYVMRLRTDWDVRDCRESFSAIAERLEVLDLLIACGLSEEKEQNLKDILDGKRGGMTEGEIAKKCNVKTGTIKSRWSEYRSILRATAEEEGITAEMALN